jgi:hypothetical protein
VHTLEEKRKKKCILLLEPDVWANNPINNLKIGTKFRTVAMVCDTIHDLVVSSIPINTASQIICVDS